MNKCKHNNQISGSTDCLKVVIFCLFAFVPVLTLAFTLTAGFFSICFPSLRQICPCAAPFHILLEPLVLYNWGSAVCPARGIYITGVLRFAPPVQNYNLGPLFAFVPVLTLALCNIWSCALHSIMLTPRGRLSLTAAALSIIKHRNRDRFLDFWQGKEAQQQGCYGQHATI